MRIISSVLLCVLAFCSPTLTACTDNKASSVALVNPLKLIQISLSGKAAVKHLTELEAGIQRQIETAQKIIEKQPGNERLRLMIQESFTIYQQLVNREQAKVTENINVQMKIAMEVVRARKKFDIILSSDRALTFADDKDVTMDVLMEMDKSPLELKPVIVPPIEIILHEKQASFSPAKKQ